MTNNNKIKKLKRAVLTVEAAVLVPLAAGIMAMLIGYVYFAHESVWSTSAAYEAAFYGAQMTADGVSAEERISERLEERYEDSVMNFAENDSKVSVGLSGINISWSYGILEELFGDLFSVNKEAGIAWIDPVTIKRLLK